MKNELKGWPHFSWVAVVTLVGLVVPMSLRQLGAKMKAPEGPNVNVAASGMIDLPEVEAIDFEGYAPNSAHQSIGANASEIGIEGVSTTSNVGVFDVEVPSLEPQKPDFDSTSQEWEEFWNLVALASNPWSGPAKVDVQNR